MPKLQSCNYGGAAIRISELIHKYLLVYHNFRWSLSGQSQLKHYDYLLKESILVTLMKKKKKCFFENSTILLAKVYVSFIIWNTHNEYVYCLCDKWGLVVVLHHPETLDAQTRLPTCPCLLFGGKQISQAC